MKSLQFDGVVTIIPTSKHGLAHDIAKVEIMIQMETPFPADKTILVPAREIPEKMRKVFEAAAITYEPRFADTFVEEVSDIPQDALNNETEEVFQDAIEAMKVSLMDEVALTPIKGTKNFYSLSYQVPVYKNSQGKFVFAITEPFKGIQVATRGSVELVVILPENAVVDRANTKGIAENGGVIEEQVTSIPQNKRTVISFFYQNDPHFQVHYTH